MVKNYKQWQTLCQISKYRHSTKVLQINTLTIYIKISYYQNSVSGQFYLHLSPFKRCFRKIKRCFGLSKQRFIFPILCFTILKLDFSDLFRRFSRKTHQFELLIFQPKILNILFANFVYLNKRKLIA